MKKKKFYLIPNSDCFASAQLASFEILSRVVLIGMFEKKRGKYFCFRRFIFCVKKFEISLITNITIPLIHGGCESKSSRRERSRHNILFSLCFTEGVEKRVPVLGWTNQCFLSFIDLCYLFLKTASGHSSPTPYWKSNRARHHNTIVTAQSIRASLSCLCGYYLNLM